MDLPGALYFRREFHQSRLGCALLGLRLPLASAARDRQERRAIISAQRDLCHKWLNPGRLIDYVALVGVADEPVHDLVEDTLVVHRACAGLRQGGLGGCLRRLRAARAAGWTVRLRRYLRLRRPPGGLPRLPPNGCCLCLHLRFPRALRCSRAMGLRRDLQLVLSEGGRPFDKVRHAVTENESLVLAICGGGQRRLVHENMHGGTACDSRCCQGPLGLQRLASEEQRHVLPPCTCELKISSRPQFLRQALDCVSGANLHRLEAPSTDQD
mmetsp:Transcript_82082/g.253734  ORF Transcript_82082/g.253734 Transcript_82082/m.253734 type:complete len:269 (+) Transcript_82082:702-1508(+)